MKKTSSLLVWILDISFVITTIWWVTIFVRGINNTENFHFNFVYALIVLLGGVIALNNSREWGGIKSLYGKSLIGFGLALISWAIGGLTWAYYNYGGFTPSNFINPQTISGVPFPGLPDIGFSLFYPFGIYGLFCLVKAVGFKYVWQTVRGKLFFIVTPILATLITFIMYKNIRELQIKDSSAVLSVIINYYYTVGDAFMIGIAINLLYLSSKFSGGKLKASFAFLLVGLIGEYLADFFFNYRTATSTYFNADFSDMLYAASLYLISVGCSMFTLRGKR